MEKSLVSHVRQHQQWTPQTAWCRGQPSFLTLGPPLRMFSRPNPSEFVRGSSGLAPERLGGPSPQEDGEGYDLEAGARARSGRRLAEGTPANHGEPLEDRNT